MDLVKSLDAEIGKVQSQLDALIAARTALGPTTASKKRRRFSQAQRAAISKRMKKAWASRRKAKAPTTEAK